MQLSGGIVCGSGGKVLQTKNSYWSLLINSYWSCMFGRLTPNCDGQQIWRMPAAVTEPKTSPWKVTAQNVEERIKLKHNSSRIALALSNAKIHRPGLYLSANTTFNCSNSTESTAPLNTTLKNRNSIKTKPSKRAKRVNCKQTDDSKNGSDTCSSDASGRTVSKLDSRKLHFSCRKRKSLASYKFDLHETICVADLLWGA